MRIMIVWPPSVPTYFNAGYHLPLWEVAGYLRQQRFVSKVSVIDGGLLNVTWAYMAKRLMEKPDILAILNEFDNVAGLKFLVSYARTLTPSTSIITFGRASANTPGFFERYDVDAIVCSGDWEAAVAAFAERRATNESRETPGVSLRRSDGSFAPASPGIFLPADEWAYPNPEEVPWEHFNAMYENDTLRFSGFPNKQELSVIISRGCPIGCSYCLITKQQGRKERRRSVDSVMEYIERVRSVYAFDYLATHSPTFTLDRSWVMDFARRVERYPDKFEWKTCTTLHHLDEELIDALARSRCLRLSVGLETLDENALALLPRAKQTTEDRLRQVCDWCSARGIELNCLVMLGMPGQTMAGIQRTVDVVREIGARLRPMMYTDFDALQPDTDEHSFFLHTRQLLNPSVGDDLDPERLNSIRFVQHAKE